MSWEELAKKLKNKLILDMYILGRSAYYHDSAAYILKDLEIIAAAQEERFNRKNMIKTF